MRFTDPPGEAIIIDGRSVWVYTPEHDARARSSGWRCRAAARSTATTCSPGCSTGRPSGTRPPMSGPDRLNGRSMDVVELVPAVPDLPFERAIALAGPGGRAAAPARDHRALGRDADADAVEGAGRISRCPTAPSPSRCRPASAWWISERGRRSGSRGRAARSASCACAVARRPGRSGGRRSRGAGAPRPDRTRSAPPRSPAAGPRSSSRRRKVLSAIRTPRAASRSPHLVPHGLIHLEILRRTVPAAPELQRVRREHVAERRELAVERRREALLRAW